MTPPVWLIKSDSNVRPAFYTTWGGGLVWACVAEGTDLRQMCGPFAGHATLVRASPDVRTRLPVFHPQPQPLKRIADELRAKFDPRQILNPGLMG